MKAAHFYNEKEEPKGEIPSYIPRVSVDYKNKARDASFRELQQKMKDNGWKLYVEEKEDCFFHDIEEYFMHPSYDNLRVNVYNYATDDGKLLKFPIIAHYDDLKGLGCSFDLTNCKGRLQSNEWKTTWDTRKGRRREKYYAYLKRRQNNKKEYENQQAQNQKAQNQNNAKL